MSEQDYRVSIKTGDFEVAAGLHADWRENMTLPMYREYWGSKEPRFGHEFRDFINAILAELGRVRAVQTDPWQAQEPS